MSFNPKDFNITKFDGSNFAFWKFQIWLTFEQNDLCDVVQGKEKQPDETKSSAGVVTNSADIKKWKQKDILARSIISATMVETHLRKIMNCTTAAEMWKRLVNQYEQHAAENKHLLQQQFFEYCYQKGNDIMTHITAIETLATRLKDLGVTVDDDQIITKIVCTLPPSFRFAISAWDNVPSADKTISLLTSRLLKEETMNKVYGGQEEADSAFFAKRGHNTHEEQRATEQRGMFPRRRGRGRGGSTWDRRDRYCDGCGRYGHLRRDCYGGARPIRKQEEQAGAASAITESYAFTSFTSTPETPSDKWFADSGASLHMTEQKSFLYDFEDVPEGKWPVSGIGRNSEPLYARGRGNMKIETFADGQPHYVTISNVLYTYVPNLI